MPSPTTAGAECDICDSPIGPEEGPAGNGECHSASGHEVVCDRCMDTLSAAWLDYIEGRGPRPEGPMPHERQTPSPECAECERLRKRCDDAYAAYTAADAVYTATGTAHDVWSATYDAWSAAYDAFTVHRATHRK